MMKSNSSIKKEDKPAPSSVASAIFTIIGIIVIGFLMWGIYAGEKSIQKESIKKYNKTIEERASDIHKKILREREILSEEVKAYEEETVIQVDTLDIEQIKIETH